MHKSDIKKMPPYFDRYINLAEDVSCLEALQISLQELENAPFEKWQALGERVYAPNKWTIKDILQHCIDTERVFAYRVIAIARGEKQIMTPYEEDDYANNAQANRRTLEDLLEESLLVRKGTIAMFKSFTPEMLHELGNGAEGMQYCPLSLGFVIAGHQRWHFKVIEERYFPLL